MEEIVRNYNMSNADLCMFTSNLIVKMTRDSAEFAERGVDSIAIAALESLGNEFEVFPPDEVYVGDIKDAVSEKNTMRDDLIIQIQKISGYVEQKWGISSGKYSALKIKNLQRISDVEFLFACRNVVDRATVYLPDLSSIGLTQAMIDTLETDSQSFEDKLNEITTLKELRDSKAYERTEKGNNIYVYVSMYCKIGKLIWENVNEAKYNDYVIYPKTPDLPGKVLNMAYELSTHTVSWDAAPNADDYQLERKYHTDTEWIVVYEGEDLSVVDEPPTSGTWDYRCRGQNDEGYGIWSDELIVIIPV